MRFLADESCDAAVVRTLRSAGHDVVAVADESPGAEDRVVIDLSRRADRVLLTEDKDSGQLVFATRSGTYQSLISCFLPPLHQLERVDRHMSEPGNVWTPSGLPL